MPYSPHPYIQEPSEDAIIWRFMDMDKFRDLMANQELCFRRADRFDKDPNEGIPPDEWLRTTLRLRKFMIEDEVSLSHHKGSLAQFREASYISCWHLFERELLKMWMEFAPYGVAICSRYSLLKAAINNLIDPVSMGLTRYGYRPTDPHNLMHFIYTKGASFSDEREVRIVMRCNNPVTGNNRHFGPNNFPHDRPLDANPLHKWVHEDKRRRIALGPLLTDVVVSPCASNEVYIEVQDWVKLVGKHWAVKRSELTNDLLPTSRE